MDNPSKSKFFTECKTTLKLAIPIMVGNLAQMAMGIIDSVMIGRTGSTPLASASFANGIITVLLVFGIGTSNVVGPLLSQLHGEKKVHECGATLIRAIVLFFVFGVLLSLMTEILSHRLILFQQTEEVTDLARNFLRILGLTMPLTLVYQCYKQFVEAYGKSGRPMQLMLIAVLINVVLNWFLIYGHGPFPRLGLVGAGIGTFAARLFLLVAIVHHVHSHPKFKEALTSFKKNSVKHIECWRILRLGLPSGAQYLFEVGAFVFAAIMMGWMGAKALAAHQIAIGIASVTFMCAVGVSVAGGLRVSLAKGLGDYRAVRLSGFAALSIISTFMVAFGIIIFILKSQIPQIYIKERDVIELASKLLLIAVAFQVFDGIQAVSIGLLRGILDMRVPTILALFSYMVVCLPVAYYCGFVAQLGPEGIWFGLMSGLIVASVCLVMRFDYITKKRLLLQ